jgi:hypothetical protein
MNKAVVNFWRGFLIVVLLAGCTRDWSQYESREEGGNGGDDDGGHGGASEGNGGAGEGNGGASEGNGGAGEGNGGASGGVAGTGDGSGGAGDGYCGMPGAVEPCLCRDGRAGSRTCLPDGFYSECICGEAPECVSNQTAACVCDDGSSGSRVCLEDGYWGECLCRGGGGEPSSVCGNDIAEGSEECDGIDLRGATCGTLGEGWGTLYCLSSCRFDLTMCTGTGCGNGAIDVGEQCDGVFLNGQSCGSLGMAGGTLSCDPLMCVFDTTMCFQYIGGIGGGYMAGTGGAGDRIFCTDTCSTAYDGLCDDGGPGSLYSVCEYGTDCNDCGARP